MTDAGYLLAGWGISLAALAVYAVRLMVRGRKLSRQVPEDQRRWIDS